VFYTFLKRCHDYPAGLGIFTGGELLIFFLFQVFLHNIYFILFYIFLSLLCVPSDIPSQAICRSSFSVKPELVTAKKENCVHTRTQTVLIPPSFSLLVWFNNKNLGVNEFRFYVDCTQLLQRAPLHFIMNNSI
jgi:hypothetical protein